MNTTVRQGTTVVGWYHKGGCQNPRCKREMKEGRLFHAIPRVGTLPTYHYATAEEAVAVILSAAK